MTRAFSSEAQCTLHGELGAMNIFVGRQTNCYANTKLLGAECFQLEGAAQQPSPLRQAPLARGRKTSENTIGSFTIAHVRQWANEPAPAAARIGAETPILFLPHPGAVASAGRGKRPSSAGPALGLSGSVMHKQAVTPRRFSPGNKGSRQPTREPLY